MKRSLEDLLAEFVGRRESGETLDPDSFARGHPEAGEELREALQQLRAVEAFFPAAEPIPESIGEYRVLSALAAGGMGRVLCVEHRSRPGERLALKLLRPAAAANPRAFERFRREGDALRELDHPNLVRVREVGTDRDAPYIVMDFVAGESLATIVSRARRELASAPRDGAPADALELPGAGSPLQRVARVVRDVARAASHAHAKGLLHRDIKPGNVMLTAEGRVQLVDFGLAQREGSANITATGDLLGTPHYMAPEQARGERADERTDVYGLGALLYELLTLRPPHAGSEPLEVLEDIRRRPVPDVARFHPGVPAELATLVRRAMASRRTRRYASAAAVAEDLEAWLGDRPITGRPAGLVERIEDLVHFRPRLVGAAGLLAAFAIAWFVVPRSNVRADPARLERAIDRGVMAWSVLRMRSEGPGDTLGEQPTALQDLQEEVAELSAAAGEVLQIDPSSAAGSFLAAMAADELPGPTGEVAIDAMIDAERARRAGDVERALAAYARAANVAPGSPLPVTGLALTSFESGDAGSAERELTAAVRRLPQSAALVRALSRILCRRGAFEEAERELTLGIRHNADAWRLWFELALVQYKLGRLDEGLEAADEAVRLSGRRVDTLNNYATLVDRKGRRQEARALYAEVLELDPEHRNAPYNMALSYDSECRIVEALEWYRRAMEVDPGRHEPYVAIAWIQVRQWGNCKQCEAVYEEHPELLQPDEAAENLVRGLTRDPRGTIHPDIVLRVANETGQWSRIEGVLEQLIERGDVDQRSVRLMKTLRHLREWREDH